MQCSVEYEAEVDSPIDYSSEEIMSEEPSDEEDEEDDNDDFIDDSDDAIDPRMSRLAVAIAGKMFERGYTPEFLMNELVILYSIIGDDQNPRGLNQLLGYEQIIFIK